MVGETTKNEIVAPELDITPTAGQSLPTDTVSTEAAPPSRFSKSTEGPGIGLPMSWAFGGLLRKSQIRNAPERCDSSRRNLSARTFFEGFLGIEAASPHSRSLDSA
jgi:hypothetical protein